MANYGMEFKFVKQVMKNICKDFYYFGAWKGVEYGLREMYVCI